VFTKVSAVSMIGLGDVQVSEYTGNNPYTAARTEVGGDDIYINISHPKYTRSRIAPHADSSVVIHEGGHLFGLRHQSNWTNSIMNYYNEKPTGLDAYHLFNLYSK